MKSQFCNDKEGKIELACYINKCLGEVSNTYIWTKNICINAGDCTIIVIIREMINTVVRCLLCRFCPGAESFELLHPNTYDLEI